MTDSLAGSQPQNNDGMQPAEDDAFDAARIVAQIAEDFRGRDTVVLDMRPITPIVDFFVITTAGSQRQMRAMAEEADRVLKKRGHRRLGAEGSEGDGVWLLHDYGDVVLHVFSQDGRDLYDLESLWSDAPRVAGLISGASPAGVASAQPDPIESDPSDE